MTTKALKLLLQTSARTCATVMTAGSFYAGHANYVRVFCVLGSACTAGPASPRPCEGLPSSGVAAKCEGDRGSAAVLAAVPPAGSCACSPCADIGPPSPLTAAGPCCAALPREEPPSRVGGGSSGDVCGLKLTGLLVALRDWWEPAAGPSTSPPGPCACSLLSSSSPLSLPALALV